MEVEIYTILGLSITILLFILGLCNPKSKIIFKLQIAWIWVLLALNDGGVDYISHTMIYRTASLSNLSLVNSWLYIAICYFAKTFGLSFNLLNMFFATIGLYLLSSVIKKNTKYPCVACSFFLVYPLVDNIIQKRFFIGSCFAIYGINLLLKREGRYNLKSLLYILIGSFLHQAVFIYLIFWILLQLNIKLIKRLIFIFIILAYLSIPVIPKIMGHIFPGGKVDLYFNILKIDLFDAICWMILHIIFVILASIFYKWFPLSEDKKQNNYESEIYKLNLISLLVLPLYYYEPTFIRIYRSILIFSYILIANRITFKMTKKGFLSLLMWNTYLMCVYLMIYVFTGSGFSRVVAPEFYNNSFIRMIAGWLS